MKRVALVFLLACLAQGAFAQRFNPQVMEKLGLTEDQIQQISEIDSREDRIIRESQVELNIYKAQLEKLLLGTDPNMREVERILRDTTEWKLKSELAEVRRRVEIRKVMGEETWERFLQALRAIRARQQPQQRPDPQSDQRNR